MELGPMLQVTSILTLAVSSRWTLDPCHGFDSSLPHGRRSGWTQTQLTAKPQHQPWALATVLGPHGVGPAGDDTAPCVCCCQTLAL